MSILDWINFGKVSAERDDLLQHYFFDNGVLKGAIDSPSTFLFLGRKGAGKTAVFKHLCERRDAFIGKECLLIPLSFEDYNWNIHALLMDEGRAESLAYKQSWRFVILTECIRAFVENFEAHGRRVPKPIAASKSLLEKLFESPIPSIGRLVGEKLLSLSSVSLPKGGVGLEDGDLESLTVDGGGVAFEQVKADKSLQRKLSENIGQVLTLLEASISSSLDDLPRIFICFDKVDEAWDDVSFEDSKRVIAGLVAAGDSIASAYGGAIRPLIFLREDIFDVLSINDANKLREDCGTLLHWTRASLAKMLLHRVNYFGQIAGVEEVSDIDALFDKKELRQRNRPLNHLIKRTMMRPRDLIAFCGRIVQNMKEKADDPFSDDPVAFELIETSSVYESEPGYSEWLEQEVLDEWAVQRPEIRDLFNALRNNSSTNFSKADLSRELDSLGLAPDQAAVDSYLRFLFDISVIGFKLGQASEWKFKCFYPSQGFVASDEYRVHEGLVRALNLTETRDRSGSTSADAS